MQTELRQQWTTSNGKNRQGLEKDFELLLQSFYIKKQNNAQNGKDSLS